MPESRFLQSKTLGFSMKTFEPFPLNIGGNIQKSSKYYYKGTNYYQRTHWKGIAFPNTRKGALGAQKSLEDFE